MQNIKSERSKGNRQELTRFGLVKRYNHGVVMRMAKPASI